MSKVSIVKCDTYKQEQIYKSLKQAIDLIGGIAEFVKPDKRVLLKPNLLKVAKPDEAVITHPEFIRAVIRLIKTQTSNIILGDSPGGLVKTGKIYDECGLRQIAEEEQIQLIKFDRIKKIDGIPFAAVKDEVDVIISLPKFKTHNLTGITAAVKNVFGLVPGLYKVHCHKMAPNFRAFSKDMAKIFTKAVPHLNIVDAVLAMDGEGPNAGNPYKLGLIVASKDAVATDAVLSKIVGVTPLTIATTKEAYDLKAGEADLSRIEIIGERVESVSVSDFKMPKISLLFRMPNFIIRGILRLLPIMMAVDNEKCTRCQMCVNVCPQKTIQEVGGSLKKIKINFSRCILCLCCSETCPSNAIYLRFLRRRQKK